MNNRDRKKNTTARDVTAFCTFFSAWKSGKVLHIWGHFLAKLHSKSGGKLKKLQWRRCPENADFCPLAWSKASWSKCRFRCLSACFGVLSPGSCDLSARLLRKRKKKDENFQKRLSKLCFSIMTTFLVRMVTIAPLCDCGGSHCCYRLKM